MSGQRRRENYIWFNSHGKVKEVKCHWCQVMLKFRQATVDHIIPRSDGGTNKKRNLVIAC